MNNDLLGELELEAAAAETEPRKLATKADEDLLAGMGDTDATPWKPATDDDAPTGIQGTVIYVGTVETDAKYGAVREVPAIEVRTADGEVWGVRAYHGVLQSQIERANPRKGDLIAIKYFGKKEGRGGNSYHNYKAVSRAA